MLKRFFTLDDFIDTDDKAMKDLTQFESVTKMLQKLDFTLSDVREVFDAILDKFPSMSRYLAVDGAVVHSPTFVNYSNTLMLVNMTGRGILNTILNNV